MADDLTTTSSAAYGMNALISARAVQYYDKARVFAGLIGDEYKFLVPSGAKSIEVDQLDYLTLAAETEATAKDSEYFVTTPRTLTPAVWTTNVVTSWLKADNTNNHFDQIAEAAGVALAVAEDVTATISFAALYVEAPSSGPDHEIGTSGVALNAATIRQGWSLLLTAGARGPINYVIDPAQANELLADAEFRQSAQKVLADGSYAVTTGVNLDRYLGTIFGVHVWIGNAMISSSGVHSMMFGRGAMGLAYKMVSTPVAPTPAELSIGSQWDNNLRGWRTTVMTARDTGGIAFTNTTNAFMVDIIS